MHNLVNLIRFIEHISCKRKIKTTIAGHVEWPNIKSEVIKFPMWYFVASEKVGFSITDRSSVLARWQGNHEPLHKYHIQVRIGVRIQRSPE